MNDMLEDIRKNREKIAEDIYKEANWGPIIGWTLGGLGLGAAASAIGRFFNPTATSDYGKDILGKAEPIMQEIITNRLSQAGPTADYDEIVRGVSRDVKRQLGVGPVHFWPWTWHRFGKNLTESLNQKIRAAMPSAQDNYQKDIAFRQAFEQRQKLQDASEQELLNRLTSAKQERDKLEAERQFNIAEMKRKTAVQPTLQAQEIAEAAAKVQEAKARSVLSKAEKAKNLALQGFRTDIQREVTGWNPSNPDTDIRNAISRLNMFERGPRPAAEEQIAERTKLIKEITTQIQQMKIDGQTVPDDLWKLLAALVGGGQPKKKKEKEEATTT